MTNNRASQYSLRAGIVAAVCLILGHSVSLADNARPIDRSPVTAPQFGLTLDRVSFVLANRLFGDQLTEIPGQLTFRVDVRSTERGESPVWSVTLVEPIFRGLQALAIDRSQALTGATLHTPEERAELAALPALLESLVTAGAAPRFPELIKRARIVKGKTDGDMFHVGDGDEFALAGDTRTWVCRSTDPLDPFADTEVVVRGHAEEPGIFTVRHIVSVPHDTLDIFVMSYCPFARERLDQFQDVLLNADRPFAVRVHYIFYEDEAGAISTMRGDEERRENLLQMRVRDEFPTAYLPFLLERLNAPEVKWPVAARLAGLTDDDIATLSRSSSTDDRRISNELSVVRDRFGVFDGSPRFFWEGLEVPPDAVPAVRALGFEGFDDDGGRCER